MRKFVWRSLVTITLCAPAIAQEPDLAPPMELELETVPADVEPDLVPMDVAPPPAEADADLAPAEMPVEEIHPLTYLPEDDILIQNIIPSDTVVITQDLTPPLENQVINTLINDIAVDNILDGSLMVYTFGFASGGGREELDLMDAGGIADLPGIEHDVLTMIAGGTLATTTSLDLSDPETVFSESDNADFTPNLQSALTDLAATSTLDEGGLPPTVHATGTGGGIDLDETIQEQTTIEIRNPLRILISTFDRPAAEPPVSSSSGGTGRPSPPMPPIVTIRLNDFERDYAEQMAHIDALRDEAIRTGNVKLLEQADSQADLIRDSNADRIAFK